jgi:hypothetical protein
MTLSQHSMDHARKRAQSTTAKGGLGARKLLHRSSYTKRLVSFFHGVSRVPA